MEGRNMDISFSDYIDDAVRILILLDAVKKRKSLKMTENKIKLYDYYLKFPCTMLGNDIQEINVQWNFDEYYAFFHWQPDLIRYRQSLNLLIAKGFVNKSSDNNTSIYGIEDLGVEVLVGMNTPYKKKLVTLTDMVIQNVIKLSDSAIEKLIREKSNIYLRTGGIKHES